VDIYLISQAVCEVPFQGKQKPRAQVAAKHSYSGPGMERGEWILGGRPISHRSTRFKSVLKVEGPLDICCLLEQHRNEVLTEQPSTEIKQDYCIVQSRN